MLMTEEQARTKWCPHARVTDGSCSDESGGNNRWLDAKGEENCRCIASDCMAWRFVDAEPIYARRYVSDDRFVTRYEEASKLPDEQADAVLDALDAERKAFSDSWKPEAPEPGMEFVGISFADEGPAEVIATFRWLVRDRRGYCGAFGRPEA
ncbi:hypothetical protein M5E06_21115 [Azospirillum sp. A1-3]|uniref:hypothetical protein n=1 Tax=Azospirillum sp. A1-3 TaxID=185874 RepID=UPI0020776CDC|nr:hypothetical protein [Azospirillum sp. A1-3]MCM8736631.1 hypothetical protein [Azospirillum sp. A1-3]